MPPGTLRPPLPTSPVRIVGRTMPPTYDPSYRDEFWAPRAYEDIRSIRIDAATVRPGRSTSRGRGVVDRDDRIVHDDI